MNKVCFLLALFTTGAIAQEQPAPPATSPAAQTHVSLRLDCLHDFNLNKGGNQTCVALSGLRLSHSEQLSPKLVAALSIDPFATTTPTLAHRPRGENRTFPSTRDTPLFIIDDYALRWFFRPSLTLAIEQLSSTTLLPSFSNLAMAGSFQEAGWYQTAVTAEYRLAVLKGMRVKIAVGNGEGENGVNLDPQQFGGLEIDTTVVDGVGLRLGISFDGNNVGSQAYEWQYGASFPSGERPRFGFSTERMAAAIYMNGQVAGARGLSMSLGMQKTRQSDINKDVASLPPDYSFAKDRRRLEPHEALIEDNTLGTATTVDRTVQNFNMSYLILADYFVGVDYEVRHITSGGVPMFQLCYAATAEACDKVSGLVSTLSQSAYTLGAGVTFEKDLKFVVEYNVTTYDKLYESFNFSGKGDERTKGGEAFNARLSYGW